MAGRLPREESEGLPLVASYSGLTENPSEQIGIDVPLVRIRNDHSPISSRHERMAMAWEGAIETKLPKIVD
jgi:hypothetical protein